MSEPETTHAPKPGWVLCGYCRRGIVESLPGQCPNPACGAELTVDLGQRTTLGKLRQSIADGSGLGQGAPDA